MQTAYRMCLCLVLGLIALKDAKERVIPDALTGSLAIVHSVYLASSSTEVLAAARMIARFIGEIAFALVVICLIAYIAMRLWKGAVLGGGDVKLMAVLAGIFGFEGFAACLAIACVGVCVHAAKKRMRLSEKLPFGPFLAIGAACVIVAGAF